MLALGQRPSPAPNMKARGMPITWRPIIEQELTSARVSLADVMSKKHYPEHVAVRVKIWRRLHDEAGVVPMRLARAFGYHHTTVLYGLGKLNRCR